MELLHQISEEGITIKHSDITDGGNIRVEVISKSGNTVLLIVTLPQFHVERHHVPNEGVRRYFNFIVDKYDNILSNVSDDNINKYYNNMESVSSIRGFESHSEYIEDMRIFMNERYKTSKEIVDESVRKILDDALISISKAILESGDPIGCLKYITRDILKEDK